MLGLSTLTFNPTLATALAAIGVGFAALWANPTRPVNRAFFSASAHVTTWLVLLFCAIKAENGLPWLRAATAVGAVFPFQLWLIRDAICDGAKMRTVLWRRRMWLAWLILLAGVPFTYWFIPAHSTDEQRVYGVGYYVYIAGIIVAYLAVAHQTIQAIRSQSGVKRLELMIVMVGGCTAAICVMGLMIVRTAFELPWLIRLQPLVILVFYTGMVVAITTSRVFDARQILLLVLKRCLLIALVSAVAYMLDSVFAVLLSPLLALFVTVAIALWFGAYLSARLDGIFQFYPEADAVRQAAYAIAQRETRQDRLEQDFSAMLRGWGKTDRAVVMCAPKRAVSSRTGAASHDDVFAAMRALRWATPERLARERPDGARQAVARFLADQQLGAVAFAEGPAVSTLVAVGTSASHRPYTYPQVRHLVEFTSIIEGTFERATLMAKVQHAEQLATVGLLGASMAHEIRNPLVTIKTFVQLLPAHYQDPKFRDKFFHLIADEVDRIDRLTEQLLDLASPRTYQASTIELHPVLRASLDLVATKAAHREVQIVADLAATPDVVFTDAAAAKQVVLNLCLNAIQALDGKDDGERRMWIATRNTSGGVEVSVTDSGPGIAPEIMPRLFQPFQTTKSSGFGLGLAICSDILANLNATISVDPPVSGRGATFRVIFPCQPSLS